MQLSLTKYYYFDFPSKGGKVEYVYSNDCIVTSFL